jgi:hypothetical protein
VIDLWRDLAQGTKDNEALRVFTASGYYDLATAYFAIHAAPQRHRPGAGDDPNYPGGAHDVPKPGFARATVERHRGAHPGEVRGREDRRPGRQSLGGRSDDREAERKRKEKKGRRDASAPRVPIFTALSSSETASLPGASRTSQGRSFKSRPLGALASRRPFLAVSETIWSQASTSARVAMACSGCRVERMA